MTYLLFFLLELIGPWSQLWLQVSTWSDLYTERYCCCKSWASWLENAYFGDFLGFVP